MLRPVTGGAWRWVDVPSPRRWGRFAPREEAALATDLTRAAQFCILQVRCRFGACSSTVSQRSARTIRRVFWRPS